MSVPWYTRVKVEMSGKAVDGAGPIALRMDVYDNGVMIGYAEESNVELHKDYFVELELGSADGNAAGVDLGEHRLSGILRLTNAEGSVEYPTDTLTLGIGQVPTGVVT